jgi:hypothetical protein
MKKGGGIAVGAGACRKGGGVAAGTGACRAGKGAWKRGMYGGGAHQERGNAGLEGGQGRRDMRGGVRQGEGITSGTSKKIYTRVLYTIKKMYGY